MAGLRQRDNEIVSYLTLRRVVGVLGVALPVVVAMWGAALCGCGDLRPSISHYYEGRTGDLFVGILFTIAWFLFTYQGHERQDDIAGNVACISALGVALVPTTGTGIEPALHLAFAAALFLVLAYFSLFLFTKTGGDPTPMKLVRNRVYRGAGVVMLAAIALIAIYKLWLTETALAAYQPVFWLEWVALWAFGLSWFVKGETLWKDR